MSSDVVLVIVVATALAVSWKPFVKSKASAVPTTIQRTTSSMPYRFLIITPSRMLAARSVESMASSRRSKMSFQRITTIGSMPLSNNDAIASLFDNGIDPMVVIRWKDIFEALEAAIDACETVAHVLEGITLKAR